VNVDVDDAGKEVPAAGIDLLARGGRDLGGNLDDLSVADRDVRNADTIGGHDRATTHE
jgi:hypothetical protein